MSTLYNTHVKLLAFDFLALSFNPAESSFSRKGVPLSRAETVGVVVTRELKPGKFLKFTIDDGTGCIVCVLWLNQLTSAYFSKQSPPAVRSIAQMAANFASEIQLGVVARARGRITGYRGMVQLTVSDVVVEKDPNAQLLHWLDCVNLARKCYDKFCKVGSGDECQCYASSAPSVASNILVWECISSALIFLVSVLAALKIEIFIYINAGCCLFLPYFETVSRC